MNVYITQASHTIDPSLFSLQNYHFFLINANPVIPSSHDAMLSDGGGTFLCIYGNFRNFAEI